MLFRSGAVGGFKQMIKLAVEHATQRKQFKTRIADFEMIREKIAEMTAHTYVLESMVYMTAGLVDKKVDYSLYREMVAETTLHPHPVEPVREKDLRTKESNDQDRVNLDLPRLTDLPPDHPARRYWAERKIPVERMADAYWAGAYFRWVNDVLIPEKFTEKALARDAGALRAAPAGSTRKGRLEGVRILVAEDDAMNRVILEELLALEGARVESVGNGRLLLERFQGGPGDFDIIIADVQMPEMDGNEAARRITAQDPDMPIIGLTARVMADEQARCLASGMVAHVGKPAQMDQLIGVIRENLPLGRARPA